MCYRGPNTPVVAFCIFLSYGDGQQSRSLLLEPVACPDAHALPAAAAPSISFLPVAFSYIAPATPEADNRHLLDRFIVS